MENFVNHICHFFHKQTGAAFILDLLLKEDEQVNVFIRCSELFKIKIVSFA